MSRIRVVALILVTALVIPALRAAEGPMDVARLIELHQAGIGDELIGVLAQREGVVPLGSDEVLTLSRAGFSRTLLGRLVEISQDTVRIENRDGVTVIAGVGPDVRPDPDERDEEADFFEPPALPPAGPVVTVSPTVHVEAPPQQVQASENGYPAGATFGWSGGAVFLPARFGGSEPSAFGRTIVAFTDPACCAPVLAPAPPVPVERTPPRMIPVRTSRGELWIPN